MDAMEDPATLLDHRRGGPETSDYGALIRAITGQQVSVHAARAIDGRLRARYGDAYPTPEQVLADDPVALKTAVGLSRMKVAYLRSLAEHALDGSLELGRLNELDDDAVIAELVAVKGIGEWTAQIFLMFQLGRPDVLAVGDLGVRRGAQLAYGMPELPTPAELTAMAQPWRPHRSVACRLLWWSLNNAPG